MLKPCDSGDSKAKDQSLRIGVVLPGGQAHGGHNVISAIFGKRVLWVNVRQIV